jgi:hypothetical protein
MLCGEYRGNQNYCEAYITREEFDRMQKMGQRTVKVSTEHRDYIFSGLVICPICGRRLSGNIQRTTKKSGRVFKYKYYRCFNHLANGTCPFNKRISERVLEQLMLENIEVYLDEAKVRNLEISDAGAKRVPDTTIDDLEEQIDRLNYSWRTGKIKKVEQYEMEYAELTEKLEKAQAEAGPVEVKDFSKIEEILHKGWRAIYNALDDSYKRAFWRSFIHSIEVEWTTETKRIVRVNFF